ncbi:hypothetical protein KAR10_03200 [bacterium]|nr:hypothetical protein [bacterium]
MPGKYLNLQSTIQCPHGGKVILQTKNQKVSAQGTKVLLESDVPTVAGCSFTLPGPKPSPCVKVEWQAGTTKATVRGEKILMQSSIGLCKSAEGALQGTAIIGNTQPKAEGV